MANLRAAAQQALGRAKWINDEQAIVSYEDMMNLRAALEQPEQEQEDIAQNLQSRLDAALLLEERRQEIAQPRHETEQEPVAWVEKDGELVWCDKARATGRNLYIRPPRREWVGLKDEEIDSVTPYCHNEFDLAEFKDFARAIEQALKEKNHE